MEKLQTATNEVYPLIAEVPDVDDRLAELNATLMQQMEQLDETMRDWLYRVDQLREVARL